MGVLICVAVPWGGIAVVDTLESRRAFCNACHLPDGSPLHARQARLAREHATLDLTGVHFAVRGEANFTCATCHRGVGWGGRGRVLGEAFANTLRYALGSYREPERLAFPIVNATCTACHAEVWREEDAVRFHGIRAHLDQASIRCTACHPAHAAAAEPAVHARRVAAVARAVCTRCHKGSPPADHVLALLARHEQALMARMR